MMRATIANRASTAALVTAAAVATFAGSCCFTATPGVFGTSRLLVTATPSDGDRQQYNQQPHIASPVRQGASVFAAAVVVSMVAAAAVGQQRVAARRGARVVSVAAVLEYGEDLSVPADAFIALGVAHCFEQGEGGKKLQDVWVLEPVTAPTVEVINNGAQTSFETLIGTTVGELLAKDASKYPKELFAGKEVRWAENLEFRTGCAARTWMRDHARDVIRKQVPHMEVKTGFNTCTESKRILNFVYEVKDSDNVKQDMSIDVYGREGEEDEKAADDEKKIAEMYNI